MKNILTEALVNSVTNASFICSYTNSAKLRRQRNTFYKLCTIFYKITQFTTIYIDVLYIKVIKKYLRN